MSGEYQLIPARHGTATFVPRGHTIMIRNTYGKQVVDTWAFALNAPPKKDEKNKLPEKAQKAARKEDEKLKQDKGKDNKDQPKPEPSEGEKKDTTKEEKKDATKEEKKEAPAKEKNDEKTDDGKKVEAQGDQAESKDERKDQSKDKSAGKSSWTSYLPSVKKAAGKEKEASTEEKSYEKIADEKKTDDKEAQTKSQAEQKKHSTDKPAEKSSWTSYLPSVPSLRSGNKNQNDTNDKAAAEREEQEKQANTKTWSSYLPSGKGFTSYIPSSDAVSAFAAQHKPDPNKSYAEQLYDFSKTPVGAAGLAAATGSGKVSTLYAAYSAYAAHSQGEDHPMEYMSMAHTHTSTQHLIPRAGDTFVSNLRNPIMTLVEDTTPGVHDTVIAACDPHRYRVLSIEKWEEHGSCAENLVVTLKELNEKAGLKGSKAIGSEVTVNSVPAPLNLFMNVPWNDKGEMEFKEPPGGKNEYVKFKAETDIVVVMSACPMDVTPINGKKPMVAHFMVEEPKEQQARRPSAATERRRSSVKPPAKLNRTRSSQQGPTPVKEEQSTPDDEQKERRASQVKDAPKKKPKKLEVRKAKQDH